MTFVQLVNVFIICLEPLDDGGAVLLPAPMFYIHLRYSTRGVIHLISSHLISDILSRYSLLRSAIHDTDMARNISTDALYIVGLAHAYPQYSLGTQEFNDLIIRLYPGFHKNSGYIYLITTIVF
jgi:hypothetical protein